MRNLIGLIALLGFSVVDLYSQTRIMERKREADSVITTGFYFWMQGTETVTQNAGGKANIFKSSEEERRIREEERRLLEEYIDSIRVISFTNVLGLTESEAVVFWPAYNEYQYRLDKIQKKRQDATDKICDPYGKYRKSEYAIFVDTEVKSHKEEALLIEKYAEKFKTILGEKYYLLFRAEYQFLRWLLREFYN
jgi:rRNA maturation protein Nop10